MNQSKHDRPPPDGPPTIPRVELALARVTETIDRLMADDPKGQRDLRFSVGGLSAALQEQEGEAGVEDYLVRASRSIVLEEIIEVPVHLVVEF